MSITSNSLIPIAFIKTLVENPYQSDGYESIPDKAMVRIKLDPLAFMHFMMLFLYNDRSKRAGTDA